MITVVDSVIVYCVCDRAYSAQILTKGMLKVHVKRCGLELQKRLRESLSDIYYRIHNCDALATGVYQLQAKLQCKWMQTVVVDECHCC
jgi:hypothetical protein